ncbi:hypothetical protein [Lysinibacillus sp. NPDC047702]|uniref:hypothetical protein n=1 Tax=unclassified Lysinibacillus TaxID=2636778 RepID=UPI003D06CA51
MSYFLKLNLVSILYGQMFFISMELNLNYYRMLRLTGWEGQQIDIFLLLVHSISWIVASIVMYKLTAKWIARRRLVYVTTILWLPYTIIFTFLFASIFPITNQGDSPAPVQGLTLFAMIFLFPFYIAILNFLCRFLNVDHAQE